jgi:RNA polymerase sigma factor (sigma-70 family)
LPEWLFAVCRNLAIDRLRADRRTRERAMSLTESATPTQEPPIARLERADDERRAIDLLSTLPARQQEAIRLKFQGDLSYAQIAGVMKTNENNVAVLIHLGLRRLREQMQ